MSAALLRLALELEDLERRASMPPAAGSPGSAGKPSRPKGPTKRADGESYRLVTPGGLEGACHGDLEWCHAKMDELDALMKELTNA
jgi:hypothetical protein